MNDAHAQPAETATPTPAARTAYHPDVLREQVQILRQAAAARSKAEASIAAAYDAAARQIREAAESSLIETRRSRTAEIEASRRAHEELKRKADEWRAGEQAKIDDHRKAKSRDYAKACEEAVAELKEEEDFEQVRFKEVVKAKAQEPQQAARAMEQKLAAALVQIDKEAAAVAKQLAAWGVKESGPPVDADLPGQGGPVERIVAAATAAAAAAAEILNDPAAKQALGGGISGLFSGNKAGIRTSLVARQQALLGLAARARAAEPEARAWIAARAKELKVRLETALRDEDAARKSQLAAKLAAATEKRDAALKDLEAKCTEVAAKVAAKVTTQLAEAEGTYPPRIVALEQSLRDDVARIERDRDEKLAAAARTRDADWATMTAAWRAARESTAAVAAEAHRLDAAAFRSWSDLADDATALPVDAPPGLPFGHLAMSLERIPGGVSSVPDLNAFGPVDWTQPATVPWPVAASLMIRTSAEEKETASAMMQALMLRIATGLPAGQSRFTIIDPLGLGKQYAGFMHLADYDELLVTSRIWTEPQLIEQKLADITEQMEVVIQKYLRNEYESIGGYNADAEVPEPYRFVVVANFPANFNETSARRLASIASSGARCGVYLVLSVDPTQQMPSGFSLADVEQHCTTLTLKDGVYTWKDPEWSKWPLAVEQAPPDDVFTRIIQRVGKAAKSAKRVIVPFDRVAPPADQWWEGSTAEEVLAPLGPAGAKKLQFLKLGKGTSQHVLIAGKTGSGKSTLMHAMITSLALQYSPNEIQFYLIDFKKGVEFKLYDHYALPHARVIAIESEREFGLSVMEQLDRELKRRGDLFRELSVQNVAGFRQTGHPDPMPRILLLIDEFQEIFVEDDKIAQDASLILDRLVRQGRAFGIHVLLGSQTLGGSYSLPRATMGQMAVRIALQCNEADSSLILSEDNTAARLLTRPGEAIYNDANGMVEGNNPFQVVFLTDEQREQFLGSLRTLADRRTDIPHLERIVFDGNQAADPAGNPLLTELLASGTVRAAETVAPLAWMGDAIAIKDPTAAIFRRQGGANMLVVGQREDLGAALLAMSLVSLAAGLDPHPGGALGRPGRFVLFEPAIAEEKPDILISRAAGHLPHEVEVVGRLGVADAVERLAAEVKRRIDGQVLDGESVFVVVRDLGRFRELRKNDGDFGFSFGGDKKASPADNFLTVLKDGPPVGVHMIIWCDSLTNLQRTFDRNAVKEFELRVLFQMSGNDSSQLVDTPVAAKLGPQRALFIHEETGTLEKFRPYAFPTAEWLETVVARMRARPQGTPVVRPAAGTPATAAAEPPVDTGSGFGGFSAFGGGEFNFSAMLDDLPGGGDPPADDPGGPPA
ncbi:MAG: FtsK/SpoIIIE domain-containing protein [Planctomycetaceae bacterium]